MDGVTSTAHLRGSHQLEAWKSGPSSSGPILSASSCLASPARTKSPSPGNLCKMVEHKCLLLYCAVPCEVWRRSGGCRERRTEGGNGRQCGAPACRYTGQQCSRQCNTDLAPGPSTSPHRYTATVSGHGNCNKACRTKLWWE